MNSEQLKEALVKRRVNESLYSIGRLASQSESYSIVVGDGQWKVLYKERGEFTEIAGNLSESEACDLVYRMFKDMFFWED